MEIKIGDTIKLLKDKISLGKRKYVYGIKGEKCKVVSLMGDVLIVQGKKERFSVNKKDVQ